MKIAVDGPAGSGKSTISKLVAKKYNLTYLDTGAMYRSAAWLLLEMALTDDELIAMLNRVLFKFSENGAFLTLIFDNKAIDVTQKIRTPEVTKKTSHVSSIKAVRDILTAKQREIAKDADVILDGRDIGTVVLPDADLKFFIIASAEERASRRFKEMTAMGLDVNIQNILADIEARDLADSTRAVSPLKKADDAMEIDSTHLTIDEVIEIIGADIRKHYCALGSIGEVKL